MACCGRKKRWQSRKMNISIINNENFFHLKLSCFDLCTVNSSLRFPPDRVKHHSSFDLISSLWRRRLLFSFYTIFLYDQPTTTSSESLRKKILMRTKTRIIQLILHSAAWNDDESWCGVVIWSLLDLLTLPFSLQELARRFKATRLFQHQGRERFNFVIE